MPRTNELSEAARLVLQRGTVAGAYFTFAPVDAKMPRELYEEANKALMGIGGRWKKGKGHQFPNDPAEKIRAIVKGGVIINEKKNFQAFFTQPALARRVASLAYVQGCDVLEPSAGAGALVDACFEAGASTVVACEIQKDLAEELALKQFGEGGRLGPVWHGDFLLMEPQPRFDRVVMNPPFNKNQDVKHVAHALKFLKPEGGILVAIMWPNKTRKCFCDLIEDKQVEIWDVEAGEFSESGTEVATMIVKIDTRK